MNAVARAVVLVMMLASAVVAGPSANADEAPGVYDLAVPRGAILPAGSMTVTWRAVIPAGTTTDGSAHCHLSIDGVEKALVSCASGQPFSYDLGTVTGTPTVTLTPVGGWANLYLVKVDRTGFTVADTSGKARSLEFHWIALGARAGERRVVPAQIANGELDRHLDGVLFNEALTQQSGQPMWFDGKALRFDAPPATSRPKDRR